MLNKKYLIGPFFGLCTFLFWTFHLDTLMGKRRAHLSGLSRFAAQAFKQIAGVEECSGKQVSEPEVVSDPQVPDASSRERPAKRRKTMENGTFTPCPASESNSLVCTKQSLAGSYDASGLVPYYDDVTQVPEHLRKYYAQRKRYFSLYSAPPGCLLDEEGWYSVTPELIANQIAERCRCDTVLDAFCGVGGNAIAFAKTCYRVIAIDNNATRLALARHNAQIYGVADRIEFILGDYVAFARSYIACSTGQTPHSNSRKIDVVFLSPPWGGPSYLDSPVKSSPRSRLTGPAENDDTEMILPGYSLSSIQPIHGAELFHISRSITPNVAYYLPRNTDLEEISSLVKGRPTAQDKGLKPEIVEVEEEWMGTKLKALTCYFGGLVQGQEDLY